MCAQAARKILFMDFENKIFKNFKSRAKDAFKFHRRENSIPKTDKEWETILGCDRLTYVEYLKQKFKDGMYEGNYGIEGWHIDHIFPLARAKPEKLEFWLHYLNTQPLWKQENTDKADFIFDLNQVRQIEKTICEVKSIDYIDTIGIDTLKYSKGYLTELKVKGQISDSDISKIKNNHRNSEFVKTQRERAKQTLKDKKAGKPSKRQLKGNDVLGKKQVEYCLENNIPLIKRIDGSYWVDNGHNHISTKHQKALSKKLTVEIPMTVVKEMVEENNKLRQRVQELEYHLKIGKPPLYRNY